VLRTSGPPLRSAVLDTAAGVVVRELGTVRDGRCAPAAQRQGVGRRGPIQEAVPTVTFWYGESIKWQPLAPT